MENPPFPFFRGAHFENALGEQLIPQFPVNITYVLILYGINLQKNMFVDLWKECIWWVCLDYS